MAALRQCTKTTRRAAAVLLVAATLLAGAVEPGDDLRAAARKGQTKEVASLISRGVPVDAADRDGRTALMIAAQRGHAATVKLLLDRGANPEARDREGLTAYGMAVLNGRDDVVRLFPGHEPIRVQLEAATSLD